MCTQDTKAILLLNTRTALEKNSEIAPLKLSQWNDLVGRMVQFICKDTRGAV